MVPASTRKTRNLQLPSSLKKRLDEIKTRERKTFFMQYKYVTGTCMQNLQWVKEKIENRNRSGCSNSTSSLDQEAKEQNNHAHNRNFETTAGLNHTHRMLTAATTRAGGRRTLAERFDNLRAYQSSTSREN